MFEDLLKRLATALDREKIPYMVIGGQAVLVYGEPRLTRDIDLTLGLGPDQANRVVDLVKSLGLTPLVPNPESFIQETFVFPCQDPVSKIRVDLIFSVSAYESGALERVNRISVGGTIVQFASIEDVLIQKVVSGRPRDWEDVRSLLAKQKSVDFAFVEKCLKDFEDLLNKPMVEPFRAVKRLS
jgi:hypothetical protein